MSIFEKYGAFKEKEPCDLVPSVFCDEINHVLSDSGNEITLVIKKRYIYMAFWIQHHYMHI